MNLNEKLNRIKELNRVSFPTPEQIEERLKLDEEVELELRDSGLHLNQYAKQEKETVEQNTEPDKKQKLTIYEKFIKPKLKGKPMTWDEVQQLKLEAMGTRLKRHIAEDKAKMRQAKSDRFNAIFGMVTGKGTETKSTTKRTSKSKSSKSNDDDLRALLGSDNPSKYDKLVKK